MANYQMAQAVLGKDDMINGIARLTKAIALNEQLGDARLLRARILLKMGDTNGAQEDVDWLLTHADDNEDVLLMAARVAHAKGEDDEALNIYNKVTDLNPFQLDAYRERGKIRFDRGDKQGAEEDMQKLLELNPNEMADVSGDYSAEGVEQAVKQAYSNMNPFGI
jgi:tetratricopeptide (TPR) repeat protein